MWLPRIRGVLGKLMHRVHYFRATRLADVVELADRGTVVQLESVRGFVEVGMKMLLYFCRDALDLGVVDVGIGDDGVDEGTLGELERAVAEALDGHANVVGRMALVLDVEIEID